MKATHPFFTVLITVLSVAPCVLSQTLPSATPEEVGLSSKRPVRLPGQTGAFTAHAHGTGEPEAHESAEHIGSRQSPKQSCEGVHLCAGKTQGDVKGEYVYEGLESRDDWLTDGVQGLLGYAQNSDRRIPDGHDPEVPHNLLHDVRIVAEHPRDGFRRPGAASR